MLLSGQKLQHPGQLPAATTADPGVVHQRQPPFQGLQEASACVQLSVADGFQWPEGRCAAAGGNLTGGLANGTRLIGKRLGERVIEAEVATGPAKGEVVCIPRLAITPSDTNMPFTLRRLQFPVRPAFAMTVNKSQGQTLRMVGMYLPKAVFSHGQLYVALSRVGRRQAVRVLVEGGWVNEGDVENVPEGLYTVNVVYCEVL